MKKILCLLMALCMILSLTACIAPPDEVTNPGQGTEQAESTESPDVSKTADALIAEGTLLYPAKSELFRYDVYTTYVTITEYVGTETSVVVPDTIETLPVLIIANSAFEDCAHITDVTISNNVVQIYPSAFKNCTALKTVKLPTNLQSIGSSAFENCFSLTELTVPQSVAVIPASMCSSCKNLITFVWDDAEYAEGMYIQKTIGSYAFSGCSSLRLAWIPDEVVEISSGAFMNGSTELTIHGYTSSAAAHYASKYFIDFEVLDVENLATALQNAKDEAAKGEDTTP